MPDVKTQSGLAVRFGLPSHDDKVTARPPHDNEAWHRVPKAVKSYHMVGRTLLGRRCFYGGHHVSVLVKSMGFDPTSVPGWRAMGVSQQVDVLATELLRRDRAARAEAVRSTGAVFGYENDYLSQSQWWKRVQREIPVPSAGQESLLAYSPRVSVWRGGLHA